MVTYNEKHQSYYSDVPTDRTSNESNVQPIKIVTLSKVVIWTQ